jgi:hypothetical protein
MLFLSAVPLHQGTNISTTTHTPKPAVVAAPGLHAGCWCLLLYRIQVSQDGVQLVTAWSTLLLLLLVTRAAAAACRHAAVSLLLRLPNGCTSAVSTTHSRRQCRLHCRLVVLQLGGVPAACCCSQLAQCCC